MTILAFIIAVLILANSYLLYRWNKQNYKITALQVQLQLKEDHIRADANKRSRSVLRGQVSEHLAPLAMEGAILSDFRFIGDPIDYLYIKGTGAVNDSTQDEIDEVILLDIKSGAAKLNKTQRRIRDAIAAGKVSFAIFNPDTMEYKSWKIKSDTES